MKKANEAVTDRLKTEKVIARFVCKVFGPLLSRPVRDALKIHYDR